MMNHLIKACPNIESFYVDNTALVCRVLSCRPVPQFKVVKSLLLRYPMYPSCLRQVKIKNSKCRSIFSF